MHDDAHNAGLADDVAVLVAPDDGLEQARLVGVDLAAWVAQPGDSDQRPLPEVQERAARECEQVDAGGEDVLPHLAGADVKALLAQLGVQFGMDQVHLAQVGLRGVGGHAAAVLDRSAGMGVALDPQPRKQGDPLGDSLAEAVLTIATDRYHHRLIDDHDVSLPHPTGPSVSGSAISAMHRLVAGPQSGYPIGHLLALAQRLSGTMTS